MPIRTSVAAFQGANPACSANSLRRKRGSLNKSDWRLETAGQRQSTGNEGDGIAWSETREVSDERKVAGSRIATVRVAPLIRLPGGFQRHVDRSLVGPAVGSKGVQEWLPHNVG